MLLRKVQRDEQGNLLTCPQCDNEELVQGKYCMICGVELTAAVKHWCGEESKDAVQVHQSK